MPTFSYYISPCETPLTPESAVWTQPVPLARPTSDPPSDLIVSHGEYFNAVRSFVELDDLKIFSGVCGRRLRQPVEPVDIEQIRIYLVKHGEFYHPARIESDLAGSTLCFVLNVAVTDTGKNHLSREFYNLKRLNAESSDAFLPAVYTMGEVNSGDRKKFCMFLGEWFEDYHEFHVSLDTAGDQPKVDIWDERKGHYYLSDRKTLLLYRQAARIMTVYYNITTFEHISPWHHAAGDFIIKNDDQAIDLKLITVRGYAPLLQQPEDSDSGVESVEQILQALLIFFLKLSIRMRMDRFDGIGDLVWLGPEIVPGTVKGVFDALAQKPANPVLPDAVDTCFRYYLSVFTPEDLFELSESILPTLGSTAAEISIIKEHLADHVRLLIESINDI